MIRSLTVAAVWMIAAPALAQAPGVSPTDARGWLVAHGGVVAEPEISGTATVLKVSDRLPWTLNLYGCAPACADAQYAAIFTGPAVTADWVNAWNRENRYLKAWYAAPAAEGGEGTVVVQYDVVLTGSGPEQLAEPTSLWKQTQGRFAEALQAASR